jgi:hypothetical protein
MLSTIHLSEIREKLKQEIQAEKDNAQNEMNGFMLYNPKRVIDKAINSIYLSMKLFDRADVDVSGLKWFNEIGQNQVRNPLNEALDLLNHLQDQVENRKMKGK